MAAARRSRGLAARRAAAAVRSYPRQHGVAAGAGNRSTKPMAEARESVRIQPLRSRRGQFKYAESFAAEAHARRFAIDRRAPAPLAQDAGAGAYVGVALG